jgi:hypothetical protein
MGRWTRRGSSRWRLERAAMRTCRLRCMGRAVRCTAGTMGTGRRIRRMELVQLLAGMKDANGRVLIPHFYDGIEPLGPVERKALADAPVNDEMLGKELELGHFDGGGKHLLELLNEPSLNINGISAGQTGAHSTNCDSIERGGEPGHPAGGGHGWQGGAAARGGLREVAGTIS